MHGACIHFGFEYKGMIKSGQTGYWVYTMLGLCIYTLIQGHIAKKRVLIGVPPLESVFLMYVYITKSFISSNEHGDIDLLNATIISRRDPTLEDIQSGLAAGTASRGFSSLGKSRERNLPLGRSFPKRQLSRLRLPLSGG